MSVGKEYQRRTRMLILRAAMLKQQIQVKVIVFTAFRFYGRLKIKKYFLIL